MKNKQFKLLLKQAEENDTFLNNVFKESFYEKHVSKLYDSFYTLALSYFVGEEWGAFYDKFEGMGWNTCGCVGYPPDILANLLMYNHDITGAKKLLKEMKCQLERK